MLGIVTDFHEIDVVALNMASMIGLALGVDYSLVMVSRFREELAAGAAPRDAARIASATAGRTVLFAGIALIAAMSASLAVAPGNLMVSSGIGVLVAALISVAGATAAHRPSSPCSVATSTAGRSEEHGSDGGRGRARAPRSVRFRRTGPCGQKSLKDACAAYGAARRRPLLGGSATPSRASSRARGGPRAPRARPIMLAMLQPATTSISWKSVTMPSTPRVTRPWLGEVSKHEPGTSAATTLRKTSSSTISSSGAAMSSAPA